VSNIEAIQLGQALAQQDAPVHLSQAVVKSLTSLSLVEVTMDGNAGQQILPSLQPVVVGQTVWVLAKGSKAIILGAIPDAGAGTVTTVQSASYVPVIGEWNVGNGTNTAEYTYVGASGVGGKGHMFATGLLVFGSSGSVFASAFPYIALPVGFDFWGPQFNGPSIGRVAYDDVSAGVLFEGEIIRHGGAYNWAFPRVSATSAAHTFIQGITATIPFTWVVGDRVNWTINSAVVRTS